MIIAIDGPAASGKSTVAKEVARRLSVRHLDTGAMYRAVAWLALETGTPLDDWPALTVLAEENPVTFDYAGGAPIATSVCIADSDVTVAIRSPEVDASVSAAASPPGVRRALVEQQRRLASEQDTVVEGRDIGTVVFPDAEVKVFLTASAAERARRRAIDLANLGHEVDQAEVQARLELRDHLDSTRETSPLEAADDADLLDTTGMTIDQVVDDIVARVRALR